MLTVFADADTRRLSARLGEGGASWPIEWDGKVLASRGEVLIPEDLPPGRYPLVLVAEDFAHNLSSQILDVVVMGRR